MQSKSDILYDLLKKEILTGVWQAGSKLPRESELARRKNVALLTLRNALVKLEADHLIARVPRSGTFVLNRKKSDTKTIMLRIERYSGEVKTQQNFVQELILGVSNATFLKNYKLKICDSSESIESLKLQFQQGEYAGIIWDRPPENVYGDIEMLSKLNIPQVAINRKVSGIPHISCDYSGGLSRAMRFLRDIGHRYISLIDLDKSGGVFSSRRQEFINCLRFSGINDPERLLLTRPYPPTPDGYIKIAEHFKKNPDITAVIVSYTHIEHFMRFVKESRLNVPRDLSVIVWGENGTPALDNAGDFTILSEMRWAIGGKAAELLDMLLTKEKNVPQDNLVMPDILLRESCGLPKMPPCR